MESEKNLFQADIQTVSLLKDMRQNVHNICKEHAQQKVRIEAIDGQIIEGVIVDYDDQNVYVEVQDDEVYEDDYLPIQQVASQSHFDGGLYHCQCCTPFGGIGPYGDISPYDTPYPYSQVSPYHFANNLPPQVSPYEAQQPFSQVSPYETQQPMSQVSPFSSSNFPPQVSPYESTRPSGTVSPYNININCSPTQVSPTQVSPYNYARPPFPPPPPFPPFMPFPPPPPPFPPPFPPPPLVPPRPPVGVGPVINKRCRRRGFKVIPLALFTLLNIALL